METDVLIKYTTKQIIPQTVNHFMGQAQLLISRMLKSQQVRYFYLQLRRAYWQAENEKDYGFAAMEELLLATYISYTYSYTYLKWEYRNVLVTRIVVLFVQAVILVGLIGMSLICKLL